MKIFNQIKDSIISSDFYKKIPQEISLRVSIKYLIKASFLFAVLGLIIVGAYTPKFISSIKESASSFVDSYPENLVVTVKSGNLSINQPEPFVIPLDKKLKEGIYSENKEAQSEYKDLENILTIDTTKSFSIEEFKNLKTMVWITKGEIIALKGNDGEIQILPLSKLGDVEINKSWVNEKETFFYKILPSLVVLAFVGIYFMLFFGNFFGSIFSLFFYGLIVFFMSKLLKKELTYKQSYIMSIYAITPVIFLNSLNPFMEIPFQSLLNLLIVITIVYVNFFKVKEEKITTIETTQTPNTDTENTAK